MVMVDRNSRNLTANGGGGIQGSISVIYHLIYQYTRLKGIRE